MAASAALVELVDFNERDVFRMRGSLARAFWEVMYWVLRRKETLVLLEPRLRICSGVRRSAWSAASRTG